MITKEVVIERMEVLENGAIQVRESTRIIEDGLMLSARTRRYVVLPDSPVDAEAPARLTNLRATVQTPAIVAAYKLRAESSAMMSHSEAVSLAKQVASEKNNANPNAADAAILADPAV